MNHHDQSGHTSPYLRFFAMIATSTLVMYGLMYLNTFALEHIYFSQTRMWMALYMGSVMTIVMLAFMLGMYRSKMVNTAIFGGAAVAFALFLWLVRSQETVEDVAWMKAMIPHHSIAVLTSTRADLTDPRVRKLADEIIHAQNREIAEMRWLIEDIAANGEEDHFPLGQTEGPAQVTPLAKALSSPIIAAIDLAPMTSDEIIAAIPAGAACNFRRGVTADPIFAATVYGQGITKISGQLVALQTLGTPGADGAIAKTEGLEIIISPEGPGREANLLFELSTDPSLVVGYDGYWTCGTGSAG